MTHQHSDHNLDYGNLFHFCLVREPARPSKFYGPPPPAEMTKKFFDGSVMKVGAILGHCSFRMR